MTATARRAGRTAFVLGGGGALGAVEVGMLRALLEAGVRPDLVLGTSVGALNGAFVAADPSPAAADRLARLWDGAAAEAFSTSLPRRLAVAVRSRTHVHPVGPLKRLVEGSLSARSFADLEVEFQCVAASVERAAGHWFCSGPLVDAVLASCAVPGLLPPVRVGDEHYLDGGLVDSVPVARAVALGATTVYVLQVGRVQEPLTVPRWPWQVATTAFEVVRRHAFSEAMASLPDEVDVHVLPTGEEPVGALDRRNLPAVQRRGVAERVDRAHRATERWLHERGAGPSGRAA